ncbi:hypothetical protein [Microvirga pakistanensis]|uniref:hypothetical protein n=1 Tax=Microvirga pakistanensis TaxID=1682650 RepID=UPI00106A5AF4|nr:hypothetical protein [Microvirga pakistanensis]
MRVLSRRKQGFEISLGSAKGFKDLAEKLGCTAQFSSKYLKNKQRMAIQAQALNNASTAGCHSMLRQENHATRPHQAGGDFNKALQGVGGNRVRQDESVGLCT